MRRGVLALIVALAVTVPARAQAQTAADTLLARARVALNDLQYGRARLLARELLNAATISQPQRIAALQVLASAFFPEEQDEQKADSAMMALRQLVRADTATALPREIAWGGLDSLFEVARRTTFVATARVDPTYTLVGPAGEGTITMTANRPSVFRLAVVSTDGAVVAADSSGPSLNGTLRLRGLNGTRPVFQSGAHTLVVTAYDPAGADSIVARYGARIESPALAFEPVPATLDPTVLKPERFPPDRIRAYTAAGLLAAGTVAMAVTMRADEPVRSAFSLDAKAIAAALGLAAGAIWAGVSDKGGPLPANVTYNQNLRRDHETRVAAVNAENERRLNAYRVEITVTGENR